VLPLYLVNKVEHIRLGEILHSRSAVKIKDTAVKKRIHTQIQ